MSIKLGLRLHRLQICIIELRFYRARLQLTPLVSFHIPRFQHPCSSVAPQDVLHNHLFPLFYFPFPRHMSLKFHDFCNKFLRTPLT